MTKSRNINARYKFKELDFKKGVPMHIKADNPHSCRTSAHQYAADHGLRFKTWLTPDGVVILPY